MSCAWIALNPWWNFGTHGSFLMIGTFPFPKQPSLVVILPWSYHTSFILHANQSHMGSIWFLSPWIASFRFKEFVVTVKMCHINITTLPVKLITSKIRDKVIFSSSCRDIQRSNTSGKEQKLCFSNINYSLYNGWFTCLRHFSHPHMNEVSGKASHAKWRSVIVLWLQNVLHQIFFFAPDILPWTPDTCSQLDDNT